MATILITGATGLVGSHAVERFCAAGWRVRALVRDSGRAAWLTALGAEDIRTGDILDAASVRAAAEGCDAVLHAAATIISRGGWESYRMANVEGTRSVVAAAQAARARLVHLSSVAIYGPGARYHAPPEGADERLPLRPLPEREHYARSKRESESLALTAHREGRVWATALRPCVIYGERDRHFVPRAARLFRSGVAPVIGGGRSILAIVHAANVAHAAVLALASDRAGGEAYNVTNDGDITVAEFVRHAADGLGERVRLVDIPLSVARGGMYAAKAGLALVRGGSAASMASAAVDFMSRDNPFTSRKLVEQLGWAPVVDPRSGVRDTFRWYREETEKQRARQSPRPLLAS